MTSVPSGGPPEDPKVPFRRIALEWGRIGCIGFGGPPAHITLLRRLCVPRGWLSAGEFEDGLAVANLLPGPSSTQLAIFSAFRVGGPVGALIGASLLRASSSLSGLQHSSSPPTRLWRSSVRPLERAPSCRRSRLPRLQRSSCRAGSGPTRQRRVGLGGWSTCSQEQLPPRSPDLGWLSS